jgi:hypothetical protein
MTDHPLWPVGVFFELAGFRVREDQDEVEDDDS